MLPLIRGLYIYIIIDIYIYIVDKNDKTRQGVSLVCTSYARRHMHETGKILAYRALRTERAVNVFDWKRTNINKFLQNLP